MIRGIVTIIRRDLKAAFRSGYFVVMGIVTPLVLAVVLHVVFSGVSSGNLGIAVGHVDRDGTATSQLIGGVLHDLDGTGLLDVTDLPADTDPAAALDEHGLRVVVVVPEGFGTDPTAGEAADPTAGSPTGDVAPARAVELVVDPDAPISAGVVQAVVSSATQALDRSRLAAATAVELGIEVTPVAVDSGTSIVDRGAGARLDIGARLSAAMSSMFVLIVALLGVTSLLYERDAGTLARLLAAPIPSASVVVAKVAMSVILASIAGLAVVAATTLVIGASWGPWVGVVAVVVGFAAAATGITVLVTGAARSTASASAIQSSVAVLLAVLGGGLVAVPDTGVLGVASRLTPHFWLLEGLDSMAMGTWHDAAPAVAALMGFALVLGIPGLVLTRRRITA